MNDRTSSPSAVVETGDYHAISIVVPVYNRAGTIAATLQSAIAECREGDEIILVDDGSKDDSNAVIQELAAGNPLIRAVHQENRGVSAARNHGALLVHNDIIMFLDSDDEILPGALDRVREVFREKIDFCWSSVKYQAHDGATRIKHFSNAERLRNPLNYVIYLASSYCFCMSRDAFARTGGFDENIRSVVDTELALRLRGMNYRIIETPCFQINTGTTENQLTRNDASRIRSLRHIADKHRHLLESDPECNRAIYRSLFKCGVRQRDHAAVRQAFSAYMKLHRRDLKMALKYLAYLLKNPAAFSVSPGRP